MKKVAGFALVCWTLSVGVALSATAPIAVPATTGYQIETRPMVIGTVVSRTDQELVVNTDEGRQMTLQMDSRTMIPVDLAPGMMVRTEFRLLDDGTHYAQRIVPLRGQSEIENHMTYRNVEDRDLAGSASMTTDENGNPVDDHDADDMANGQTADNVIQSPTTDQDSEHADHAQATDAETGTTTEATAEHNDHDADDRSLPQTASSQPLIALLGVLALAGAALVWRARRTLGV